MPRLPDWPIYLVILLAFLAVSLGRRETVSAPRPPPPVPGADRAPIMPTSPFANAALIHRPRGRLNRGTAFSVNDHGVWLTATAAIAGCAKPAIVVADGWAAPAKVRGRIDDVAVLTTQTGAPALTFAKGERAAAERGFLPGFSRGVPGEAAALYLGGDGRRADWAEIGRTEGLSGPLFGFAGAPMLNASGLVAGMALGDAPRRGRIRAATPAALTEALAAAKATPAGGPPPQPLTRDNYGRASDSLRRGASVVALDCL